MLLAETLLLRQHGVIEGLEVLRGIRMAEEPVEGSPDQQSAEECPLGIVCFREEKFLCTGEGFGIELLQGRVGRDECVLQSSGPKAEFLSMSALQHC